MLRFVDLPHQSVGRHTRDRPETWNTYCDSKVSLRCGCREKLRIKCEKERRQGKGSKRKIEQKISNLKREREKKCKQGKERRRRNKYKQKMKRSKEDIPWFTLLHCLPWLLWLNERSYCGSHCCTNMGTTANTRMV